MDASALLFLLLLLPCVLMFVMMAWGHGGHSHAGCGGKHDDSRADAERNAQQVDR